MSNRVFYAVTYASLCGRSTPGGFQSVSLNSNVDLEPIFSLGQLALYDIIGGNSEFEMSAEASVDGGNFWDGAGGTGGGEAAVLAVGARQTLSGTIGFGSEASTGGGSATGFVNLSAGALTSHGLNLPLDGIATENVTVVFRTANSGGGGNWTQGTTPTNSYSKVYTRQNFSPTGLVSGTSSITFNREDLFQFGQQGPIEKVVNYPAETSMEMEYLAKNGQSSPLTFADGYAAPSFSSVSISSGATTCSIQAALVGVSYSGGDTGGGNGTYTESYAGYNNYSYS